MSANMAGMKLYNGTASSPRSLDFGLGSWKFSDSSLSSYWIWNIACAKSVSESEEFGWATETVIWGGGVGGADALQ